VAAAVTARPNTDPSSIASLPLAWHAWRRGIRATHFLPILAMLTGLCGPAMVRAAEPQAAADGARVLYLANEGVMVSKGPAKVLFDPLFRDRNDYYQAVPEDMENALFHGEPPFEDVTAIFVSHYHRDHFSPELVLRFIRSQRQVQLYAPRQVVDVIHNVAAGVNAAVFRRIHPIHLDYGDAPITLSFEGIRIDALGIPHSGWPDQVTEVENLAFRVTLGGSFSVLHLGDADVDPVHYDANGAFWAGQKTDLALPPFWFLLSERGRNVLDTRIRPVHSIAIHLPATTCPERPILAPKSPPR